MHIAIGRGTPNRLSSRACIAALVLLLHVVLIWILTQTSMPEFRDVPEADPVSVIVMDSRALRTSDPGPAVLQVSMVDAPRLQIEAPEVREVEVDEAQERQSSVVLTLLPPSDLAPQAGTAAVKGGPVGNESRRLLTRIAPQYPRDARRRREEGRTQASLRVDEAGRVVEVKVIASSGSARLDEAAVSAFRKWKFAPVATGTAPEGTWVQTAHRFLLTHVQYSLLEHEAAEDIRVSDTLARDPSPSESIQILARFLQAVAADAMAEASDNGRAQLERMRAALSEWGAIESIEFISAAGPADWAPYAVSDEAPVGISHVDCKWAVLEVRHESGKTVWMIAVDRRGKVWSARMGPVS